MSQPLPDNDPFLSPPTSAAEELGRGMRLYYIGPAEAAVPTVSWKNTPDACWLLCNLGQRLTLDDGSVLGEQEAMWWQGDTLELNLRSAAGGLCSLAVCFSPAPTAGLASPDGMPAETRVTLDLPLHNVIQAILNCRFSGPARSFFLQAKSLEMLALYVEARTRQARRHFVHCRTEYDRERLLFAREYLLQHYDLPPSLGDLARIAGLNEFKLKNGFKELFGQPVFAYLTAYKMELAERELQQRVKTASQLAYELGYSSLQHFSRAFKQHFGYPPSRLGA